VRSSWLFARTDIHDFLLLQSQSVSVKAFLRLFGWMEIERAAIQRQVGKVSYSYRSVMHIEHFSDQLKPFDYNFKNINCTEICIPLHLHCII
jgi:hypothetical protein